MANPKRKRKKKRSTANQMTNQHISDDPLPSLTYADGLILIESQLTDTHIIISRCILTWGINIILKKTPPSTPSKKRKEKILIVM